MTAIMTSRTVAAASSRSGNTKPRPITEKQFMQKVIDLARLRGWLVYHTFDSRKSEPGFPDLVCVHGRQQRVVYAELKADKGKVSAFQERWLTELAATGAEVAVWRPADFEWVQRVLLGERIERAGAVSA